jgi:hypothetical protein
MGLRGWQWLFLLEAVPALILSVVVFFYLTDRPADATWLAPEERAWLVSRLRQEQQKRESVRTYNVVQALCNPKVLALSLVYFGAVANNYGLSFFLPQIVKAFGGSNAQAGLVTAIPYVAGAIGAVWWGRHSDATRERRFHLVAALLLGSIGIAVSTAIDDPVLKIAVLCAAGFGIFGSLPVFWTLPTAFLGGAAAAGGIALINSIGNLAGFVAPFVVGSIKDATGGFTGGLLCVSAASLVAAMIVLCWITIVPSNMPRTRSCRRPTRKPRDDALRRRRALVARLLERRSRAGHSRRHDRGRREMPRGAVAELRALRAVALFARSQVEPAPRVSSRRAGTRDGREVRGRRRAVRLHRRRLQQLAQRAVGGVGRGDPGDARGPRAAVLHRSAADLPDRPVGRRARRADAWRSAGTTTSPA